MHWRSSVKCLWLAMLLVAGTAVADTHEELHRKYLAIVRESEATTPKLQEAVELERQAFELSRQFNYAYNLGLTHEVLNDFVASRSWFETALQLAVDPVQQEKTVRSINFAQTQLDRQENKDWNVSFTIAMALKGGELELDRNQLADLPPILNVQDAGQPLEYIIEPVRAQIEANRFEVFSAAPSFLLVAERGNPTAEEHYERGVVDFYRWFRTRYFGGRQIRRPLVLMFLNDPYSSQKLIEQLYPGMDRLQLQPFLGVFNPVDNLIIATVPSGYGTFLHELMHAMSHMEFDDIPAWLDEGMAMLYERSVWRDGALVPLPNWRLDGVTRAAQIDLAVFDGVEERGRLDGGQLSVLRMLMLYLDSQDRVPALFNSVKSDRELHSIENAIASLNIDQEKWRDFANSSLISYLADKHKSSYELTNPVEIEFVQDSLNRILGTTYEADGVWGPTTRGQVEEFQRRHDLEVDGRVGTNTMKQIKMSLIALQAEPQ